MARLGGDEFAVLLPASVGSVADADDRRPGPGRVRAAVRPRRAAPARRHLGGATRPCPSTPTTSPSLLQRADVAMYTAKASRRRRPDVYTPAGDLNSPNRLVLLGDLRRALDDRERALHALPAQDRPRTGDVVGLEALLRWRHPLRGFIPPAEFIPLAEQTGLVQSLTPAGPAAWSSPRSRSGRPSGSAPPGRGEPLGPQPRRGRPGQLRRRPAARVRAGRRAPRVRDHRVGDRRGPGAGQRDAAHSSPPWASRSRSTTSASATPR